MAPSSSDQKRNLKRRIEESGFDMVVRCTRCSQLDKECVRSDDSSRCNECIRSRRKCVESEPSFSDSEWRRLVAAQTKLRGREREERDKIRALMASLSEANARLDRLQRQEDLLRSRAGDFISRDIKEIEELEALEEKERKILADKQKAEEEERRHLIEILGLPPSSDDEQLAAALASSCASSSAINPSLFAAINSFEIPQSFPGNSGS
ncbi:uncharacterized protein BDV14DRAFT_186414 [Aspergillus stella-maris]|uniref:uncharacterized protein n=1 Tax=Aspergillus stella-maris TaxID=1810926 RepID=UPI003CCE4F20